MGCGKLCDELMFCFVYTVFIMSQYEHIKETAQLMSIRSAVMSSLNLQADPIPAEPQVQLSHPKARKKAKRGEQKIPPSQPELELGKKFHI